MGAELISTIISSVGDFATTGIKVLGANSQAKKAAESQEKLADMDARLQLELAELDSKNKGTGSSTKTVIIAIVIIAAIGGLIYYLKTNK